MGPSRLRIASRLPIQIRGWCEEKVGEERCLSTRFWPSSCELDGSQAATNGDWYFQLWICSWWWWFGLPQRHSRRFPQNLVAEALTKFMSATPTQFWKLTGPSCLSQSKACLRERQLPPSQTTNCVPSQKKQIAYKVDHLQCLGDASAKSVDSTNRRFCSSGSGQKILVLLPALGWPTSQFKTSWR